MSITTNNKLDMAFESRHTAFIMPTKGSTAAGAFDIYMPTAGSAHSEGPTMVDLGFAASVPPGHVALLLPRSSSGAKYGVELNNTCGIIDADYRGEWKAAIKTKNMEEFTWAAGERILQFLIVPVATPNLMLVDKLDETDRGEGGFGSSGK